MNRRLNPIVCGQCGRFVEAGAAACGFCDEPVPAVTPAVTEWEEIGQPPAFAPPVVATVPSRPEETVAACYEMCSRSPCEDDPKVSEARLRAAFAEVGRPKARVGRPPGILYVAYGLGVDSTAILVGLAQLIREGRTEFRPDYIVFADTGVEKEASYDWFSVMNPWLASQGFPPITIVGWSTAFTRGGYGSARTLEQQCILNQQMPAICATKKQKAQCSLAWKQQPQQRWLERESGLFHEVTRTINHRPWPQADQDAGGATWRENREGDRLRRGRVRPTEPRNLPHDRRSASLGEPWPRIPVRSLVPASRVGLGSRSLHRGDLG